MKTGGTKSGAGVAGRTPWGARRQARELALQFLFSLDMRGLLTGPDAPDPASAEEAFTVFCEHFGHERPEEASGARRGSDFFRPFALFNWQVERCFACAHGREDDFCRVLVGNPAARDYARALALGALRHLEDLDTRIAARARNWRLARMSGVDRNILRIAAFELAHAADAPPGVVINEALEIAKRYGEADSVAFINGILDSIRRSLPPRGADSGRTGGSPSLSFSRRS